MAEGLAAALWRTRLYVLPELRHFLLFLALSVVAFALELALGLIGFDLLTNKVFLGEPLGVLQADLLGLDHARFVTVESLGEEARFALRTVFLVVIGVLVGLGFLLSTGLGYYLTWILQRVNQRLRLAMMDRAVQLSLRFHDNARVGDAIYRVYQDSAMVTNVVQNVLVAPVIAVANLLIAITAIAFFDPYLAALFGLAVVPSVLAARAFTPKLRRQSEQARLANSDLTSHIQESVGGVRLLKSCRAEGSAFASFRRRSHGALDRAFELRRTYALLNLAVFLATALFVVVADYFMVHWVWEGKTTFGYGLVALVGFAIWNLGAFQAARDRTISLSATSVSLASLWSILQDMGVGLERAFFLLDLEPEVADAPDAVVMLGLRHGIAFDGVRFGYAQGHPVVDDVSFHATPGTITAIVGSSGAGKSTLMALLLRLYDVDAGRIAVDGVDIRRIRLQSLRESISVVLQENALFPSSIADNIRYATPGATQRQVTEAAVVSCAADFIAALPQGYGTELGERGAKLSTGQRQRLAIARAVVKNAPILILDEPTASLDVQTERELVERLAAWGKDKVIFLITHRVATIRRADRVLFLEGGVIAEQGSHDELIDKVDGRYRHYVESELQAT